MTQQTHQLRGTIFTSTAAIGWGLSGVAAGVLFARYPAITPAWLTQLRMAVAGVVLLAIGWGTGQHPLRVWKNKRDTLQLVLYGLLGIIPAQYFYFIAVRNGNASVATILQYLGLFFIVIYTAVRFRELPSQAEWIGIVVAVIGTVLIITHGRFDTLAISPSVLFWGVLSAVGSATYTLLPKSVLPKYGAVNCTGWGLIFAGIGMLAFQGSSHGPVTVDLPMIGLLVFIVLIGTVMTLFLFNAGLKEISPTRASLLDSLEPLSAAVFSVAFLGIQLTVFDIIGGLLVILAVMMLSIDFDHATRFFRRK